VYISHSPILQIFLIIDRFRQLPVFVAADMMAVSLSGFAGTSGRRVFLAGLRSRV